MERRYTRHYLPNNKHYAPGVTELRYNKHGAWGYQFKEPTRFSRYEHFLASGQADPSYYSGGQKRINEAKNYMANWRRRTLNNPTTKYAFTQLKRNWKRKYMDNLHQAHLDDLAAEAQAKKDRATANRNAALRIQRNKRAVNRFKKRAEKDRYTDLTGDKNIVRYK